MAVKDVVPKDQADAFSSKKLLSDDESLGKPLRAGLFCIGEPDPPLRTVPEKGPEAGELCGSRYDENLTDTGEHEDREGIVDHRFVVYREELLAHGPRDGKEPGSRSPCQDDTFPFLIFTCAGHLTPPLPCFIE